MTHNRILAVLHIMRFASGSVKYVIALVHGISQHAELLQHSLVRDVASCGLVGDDLCPKDNLLQVVLNIRPLPLGCFADDETYGSSDRLTKHCRKYHVHFRVLSLIRRITQWVEDVLHSCSGIYVCFTGGIESMMQSFNAAGRGRSEGQSYLVTSNLSDHSVHSTVQACQLRKVVSHLLRNFLTLVTRSQ